MKLVFIYGLPATGKLTVARELESLTGYKLFHNHLVVDCVLSVFDHACRSQLPGLLFTFAPERTVRPAFLHEALEVVRRVGGEVDFVELVCPLTELRSRMDSPSRLRYQKLTSLSHFEQLHADGIFDDSYMPEPRLVLDTSLCTPAQAALQIVETLELASANHSTRL